MRLKIKRLILSVAMLLILGLLVFSMGYMQKVTSQLNKHFELVSHTHEVVNKLNLLLYSLRDAVATQRGYLLTENPRYLESYKKLLKEVSKLTGALRQLTADDKGQQKRLKEMLRLIKERMGELADTVNLNRDKGLNSALQIMLSGKGKQAMDSIRILTARMVSSENELYYHSRKIELNSHRNLEVAVAASSVMIILLLLGSGFIIVREASSRSRAEERLREHEAQLELLVAELSRANHQLESFSYSVSHDLRAPLRHISGFIDLLKKSAGPGLDARDERYIMLISEAAGRMGALIDDLLLFSRIGRAAMTETTVNLGHLVEQIRLELVLDTVDRVIQWVMGPLPEVRGDPNLLRVALSNLIANAIKFTKGKNLARIEIGSSKENGRVVCFVRDNGAGFDMRFVDRLFKVFQRLHRPEDFEGTGIGLANVRRIIERHGGKVWAESEVNQGAAFYFSLPINTERMPYAGT